eukprot:c25481_g1_i1.p1 GENE.c25481_g1_i1~~c25481_g1_i1.p1  ORF type:complete len:696 (+),score=167.74 c25481_g1_i1:52-2139(+)
MLRFRSPSTLAAQVVGCRSFSIESYKGKKTFDKILIANRGEIAVRVIKTARLMGIKTVAVYSDADSNSKHAQLADEAVYIGKSPPSDSYLQIPKIMDAIKKTGAQAVHPGYGFLSENEHFSHALADAGVAFIGPPYKAIHAMGDKIESKKIARAAGVNTIPGFAGEITTVEDAIRIGYEVGFPVMVKATAGGGGKGMRIAYNENDIAEAFRMSKQEAMASFGDDRMLVEKFVEEPRHIEIQILCDKHGNAIYLPERECSIQRRNQKVLEEAPSVIIDPATRKAMGEQAILLAKTVGYESAGTVEMLVDKHRKFYFLEMNTRLQVEHPITEMITKQDIVAHMIAVAAGHPLSLKQEDVRIHGHAIESRVYAEDPFRKYLPSIGRVRWYQEPKNARCDSGILEGNEITVHYDPMVSKTVTWAPTRAEAIEQMRLALDTYVVSGVTHNIPLLRAVLDHPVFGDGRKITTKFLEQEYPKGFPGYPTTPHDVHHLAAVTLIVHNGFTTRQFAGAAAPGFSRLFVNSKDVRTKQDHSIWIERGAGSTFSVFESATATTPIRTFELTSDWKTGQRIFIANVEGKQEYVQVVNPTSTGYSILFRGTEREVLVQTAFEKEMLEKMPIPVAPDMSRFVQSPMPSQIKSIAVKPGDKVAPGTELLVMAAMKMQNLIRSDREGVVKKVYVEVGSNVKADEILIEYES